MPCHAFGSWTTGRTGPAWLDEPAPCTKLVEGALPRNLPNSSPRGKNSDAGSGASALRFIPLSFHSVLPHFLQQLSGKRLFNTDVCSRQRPQLNHRFVSCIVVVRCPLSRHWGSNFSER